MQVVSSGQVAQWCPHAVQMPPRAKNPLGHCDRQDVPCRLKPPAQEVHTLAPVQVVQLAGQPTHVRDSAWAKVPLGHWATQRPSLRK